MAPAQTRKIKWIAFLSLLLGGTIPTLTLASADDLKNTAAKKTANEHPYCKAIHPFYWEIGNDKAPIVSGSEGDGSVQDTTELPIASASKMVFGAYALQKMGGKMDDQSRKLLRMISGYTHLGVFSCIMTRTVGDCFEKGGNSGYSKENDGKFYYNGGHFQKWAIDHGMGSYNRTQLVTEYQSVLGQDFKFTFGAIQLAGGINTSAQNFSVFLRKVISGKLLFRDFLGTNAVCTDPRSCSKAVKSPIQEQWHYSYGHWIEDDPRTGDGAYSSPGAFGFYPWIDSSKKFYGIISRKHKTDRGNLEIGSGYASALCGRKIRKAFATGHAILN